MKKVLLHVCCGVCAGWPTEKLRADGYAVSWIFYNPNISPSEEYARRLDTCRAAAVAAGVPVIEAPYENAAWDALVEGMGAEPEGGARCLVCFRHRIGYVGARSKELGFDLFATTLSVSPHKNAAAINAVGVAAGGARFLPLDFKKGGGFGRTMELARERGLYRQDYCGCVYSKKA